MLIATEDEKFLLFYSARDISFVPGDLANIQSHDTGYITQKFILFQGFFHPNDQIRLMLLLSLISLLSIKA